MIIIRFAIRDVANPWSKDVKDIFRTEHLGAIRPLFKEIVRNIIARSKQLQHMILTAVLVISVSLDCIESKETAKCITRNDRPCHATSPLAMETRHKIQIRICRC